MRRIMMRRLLVAATAAFFVVAVAASAAGSFEVRKVSETATTITLGWDAQPGADGYRFYADGVAVSRTFDPARVTVKYAKGPAVFKVEVLHVAAGNTGSYPPPVTPPPPPPSSASVFVSPSGNDSAACSSVAPCRTLDRAYRTARPGDVVEVAAGVYGGQNIYPDASKTGSADVVFRPAPGATVVMTGQVQPGGSHVTFDGRGGTWRWESGFEIGYPDQAVPTVTDVTLEHIDARGGQSQVLNATDVTLRDLDIGGNCDGNDALRFNDPTGQSGDGGDPAAVVVEGSRIGGICRPGVADHPDCVAVSAGHDLVFRGNRIWGCGSQGLYLISELGGSIHDVLIENNMFGDCDTAGDYSTCSNSLILDIRPPGLANVTVRYNSFAVNTVGAGMRVSGGSAGSNIQVYGNAGEGPGCDSFAVYSFNVWDDTKCSPSDVQADPLFVSNQPGAAFDLHLSGGSPAIGKGDPSRFPTVDFDGQARSAPPDAGADQTR